MLSGSTSEVEIPAAPNSGARSKLNNITKKADENVDLVPEEDKTKLEQQTGVPTKKELPLAKKAESVK